MALIRMAGVASIQASNYSRKTIPRYVSKVLMSSQSFSTEIPKNVLEKVISANTQESKGVVYDKKPFKIPMEAGKKYSWCSCGRSKSQPLCDGTHKNAQLKITQKPIRFMVEETKEYWLCNCKHTNNPPFCDGSHKSAVVKEASSIIRQ